MDLQNAHLWSWAKDGIDVYLTTTKARIGTAAHAPARHKDVFRDATRVERNSDDGQMAIQRFRSSRSTGRGNQNKCMVVSWIPPSCVGVRVTGDYWWCLVTGN